jgi:hypothetical protein
VPNYFVPLSLPLLLLPPGRGRIAPTLFLTMYIRAYYLESRGASQHLQLRLKYLPTYVDMDKCI